MGTWSVESDGDSVTWCRPQAVSLVHHPQRIGSRGSISWPMSLMDFNQVAYMSVSDLNDTYCRGGCEDIRAWPDYLHAS